MAFSNSSAAASGGSSSLNGCLRNFFRSPEEVGKEIRALMAHDKEQFYFDALRVLRTSDVSPGARFLTGLMLERGLLVRALCEPALAEPRVKGIIQVLLQENPGSDLTLVRGLVDQALGKQPAGSRNPLLRVLNHLEPLADAKRIAPRLLPLLRHADPQLRSKVVGIIGRGGRNTQWLARQMADPDARIRANAVEALWGIDDQESRELLKAAVQDPHNRVVGNALLGLYRAGDCASIGDLLKMAKEGTPLFRASAAWAMGETGDARFKDVLKALTGGNNSLVRLRAATGLKQVEADAAKSELGVLWRMAALRDMTACEADEDESFDDDEEDEEWPEPPRGSRGGPRCEAVERRFRVAVQLPDGSDPPFIPGTQFRLFDDKESVLVYNVEPLVVPDELVLVLLIPVAANDPEGPMVSGAQQALAWKRPQDMWATVRYRPYRPWVMTATLIGQTIDIPAPDEVVVTADAPIFTSDHDSVLAALEQGEGMAHGNIWDAIVEVTQACGCVLSRDAAPHLVVYVPGDAGMPSAQRWQRLAALDLTVPLHAIAWEEDPNLAELCERSHGTYDLVAEDEEVGEAVERLYIRLLARYSVNYRGAAQAAKCHIHLRTAEGRGQAGVPFRPEWKRESTND